VKSNNKKLRVLHITSWYPNEKNQKEALWIQRHVGALDPYCDNEIIHLGITPSHQWSFQKKSFPHLRQIIFEVKTSRWFLIEFLTSVFLVFYIIRLSVNRKFDILNFHIAYPLLVTWGALSRFIKIPAVITEHWSAYHLNFNMDNGDKLGRIKRIFHHGLPLITVSKALKTDIAKFSGNPDIKSYVVPNVIDKNIFSHRPQSYSPKRMVFLAVSYWKYPKNPLILLQAFKAFHQENKGSELRIGGFGPLYDEVRQQIQTLQLNDAVVLLGSLTSTEISQEMNQASAFLHCSGYETFSVVCAESLACGTPVIASDVGGIKELIAEDNGILVSNNTVIEWREAMQRFQTSRFDRVKISQNAVNRFSAEAVGNTYYNILCELTNRK
jgi:L-malate glycosyltransferase